VVARALYKPRARGASFATRLNRAIGAALVPPRVSAVEFRVRYAETDQMGVVYHANYLIWCEIGRTDHIRALGTSYRDMERQGISLAVSEAAVRFIAPARYDDLIRVSTTLARVTSRTLTFDYVVANAASGARLATASTTLISLDPSGRVAALPAEVRARLSRDAGDAGDAA
jgi:acyl-CoA thioester hydrolase